MRIINTAGGTLLGTLALICAAPLAAETIELQASTAWNIDYAPNKCRLARAFGEGDDRHLLFFEQYWPSVRAGLTVAGPALKRFKNRKRTYVNAFDAQEPIRTEPFTGDVDGLGSAVIYSSIDLSQGEPDEDDGSDEASTAGFEQLDTQWASQTQYVSLKQSGRTVVFRTGALKDAFAALNDCAKTLVSDWGLDVEKHVSAINLPRWQNQKKIVRQIQSKYPAGALRRGQQAIMRMRVIVDKDGNVEDCVINEATTADRLQSPACDAMANAKFEPARGADGKPFKSFYVNSITYQIGDR